MLAFLLWALKQFVIGAIGVLTVAAFDGGSRDFEDAIKIVAMALDRPDSVVILVSERIVHVTRNTNWKK